MKKTNPKMEEYRQTEGPAGSDASFGNNGWFVVPFRSETLNVIVSDGLGWDHVSITLEGSRRNPNWDEMNFVKDIFWDDTECVVQFHPPKSEYVNNHAHCLHMWKPQGVEMPMPASILTGYKNLTPGDVAKALQ